MKTPLLPLLAIALIACGRHTSMAERPAHPFPTGPAALLDLTVAFRLSASAEDASALVRTVTEAESARDFAEISSVTVGRHRAYRVSFSNSASPAVRAAVLRAFEHSTIVCHVFSNAYTEELSPDVAISCDT